MDRVEHVMVVVPVDRDKHEAQDVAEKDRQERRERAGLPATRHLHLEDHDRDDDRDHAVGEGFEPSLTHGFDTIQPGGMGMQTETAAAAAVDRATPPSLLSIAGQILSVKGALRLRKGLKVAFESLCASGAGSGAAA